MLSPLSGLGYVMRLTSSGSHPWPHAVTLSGLGVAPKGGLGFQRFQPVIERVTTSAQAQGCLQMRMW